MTQNRLITQMKILLENVISSQMGLHKRNLKENVPESMWKREDSSQEDYMGLQNFLY